MKLFFKKLLVNFLIVSILISLTLAYSFNRYIEIRVPIIKFNLFHNRTKPSDTISLVLGNSHTLYGIDSKLLDGNTFNFASINQSPMEDYTILKHCKNPIRRVIIPISYFTNWHYLYKTPIIGEKLRIIDYKTIYSIEYPSFLNSKDIVIFTSELIKNITKTNKIGFDIQGNVIGKCYSNENEIKNSKTTFYKHNIGRNFTKLNSYLDSINLFCAKNKIDLFIIAMPYSHEYRNYTSKAGFNKYLIDLNKKYTDQRCIVLDFRAFFNESDEKIMFSDADHLSFCGRRNFSEFLNLKINLTFKY
jgi:hypothetical protein